MGFTFSDFAQLRYMILADKKDQDQPAQKLQSNLDLQCPIGKYPSPPTKKKKKKSFRAPMVRSHLIVLRIKSVTKEEISKCMAEVQGSDRI